MLGHRALSTEDYFDILSRRKWVIAAPLIIVPILAIIATFIIPAQYVSQTLVLIEGQKVSDEYVKPVIDSDLDSRLASMQEQILSRSRIQPIIERYNLYASSHMTMDERVEQARKAIVIKPIHSEIAHSGLPGFKIFFTAADPHSAQLVCGEITSLFLSENLRSREDSALGTTDFLKGQLEDAKRNLDEHDAKLAAFQREYGGKLPGEQASNVSMLSSLNTQLEAATQALARQQQDRAYIESMLAQQVQSGQPVSGELSPSNSSDSATYQQLGTPQQQQELQGLTSQEADLLNHYTADYPDVVAVRRKIAELKKQMQPITYRAPGSPAAISTPRRGESIAVQQLRSQIRAIDVGIEEKRKEQAGIQANLHMYQDRISSSPQVQEQYSELTRDYQTAQTFYDDLLTKMNHSKMATDLEKRQEGEQFRVMDQPNLPDGPTFPNKFIFGFGGLFGGLLIGLGIVAILEFQDTSLRSERDVWAFTKLPTLAVIAFADPRKTTASEGGLLKRLKPFKRKPHAVEPPLVTHV